MPKRRATSQESTRTSHETISVSQHESAEQALDLSDAGTDASAPEESAPSDQPSHEQSGHASHDQSAMGLAGAAAPPPPEPANTTPGNGYEPRTRTYFIAAEEVDWDYAPEGYDVMMNHPFTDEQLVFVEGNGHDRIGSLYRKALYFEYTDETFTQRKPRAAADAYLGMLGPIIHGVVGDTIQVVFKNAGTRPYSVHAHGLLYDKASEGAQTNDGTSGSDKLDDEVAPGCLYTYTWRVAERSGPGPSDPSSIAWLYHSHVHDGIADEYAGLIGAIIVTDAAHGTDSGVASDVDREVVDLFIVEDENSSLFAAENLSRFAPEAVAEDEDYEESNLMHGINGYVYGNGPRVTVAAYSRVRWYLLSLGTEVDLHTPHWHGNTVLEEGHRTDVVELLPATMRTVDMVPDNPGIWMFHCHVTPAGRDACP